MPELAIQGQCDERFAQVREAFARNFANRTELGACVAVSLEGEPVVNLWAGSRDTGGTLPWEEDTIVNVYSTTKTMCALVALLLADRGELDFQAPVAKYWPEYACNGKEQTQVCHFFSHSAGLSGMDEPFQGADLYDWDRVVAALVKQKPWWEPGTRSGYHALTQGFLIGEIVRRITGQTLGTFFRTELAEPLEADFHIGTPKQHHGRIAELNPPSRQPELSTTDPESVGVRTFSNPAIRVSDTRTAAWREAEIPAANGHGNARSVVQLQTVLANGGRAGGKQLISEKGCDVAFVEQTSGVDLALGLPIRFGMGYGLNSDALPLSPNQRACFWGGYGGSLIVVDADARLCMSYVMNHMESELLGDPRGMSLWYATCTSLGMSVR